MIWFLRFAFLTVLISMLAVTTWASLHTPIWAIPASVGGHPWFVATLFDAYFGFLTFYVWVAWRERSGLARGLWLVAILLLGNIAMATYMLIRLFRVPADATLGRVLGRGEGKGTG